MKKLVEWIVGIVVGAIAFVVFSFLFIVFGIVSIWVLWLDAMGWRKIKVCAGAMLLFSVFGSGVQAQKHKKYQEITVDHIRWYLTVTTDDINTGKPSIHYLPRGSSVYFTRHEYNDGCYWFIHDGNKADSCMVIVLCPYDGPWPFIYYGDAHTMCGSQPVTKED